MLGRTFSFWRRLVGKTPPAAQAGQERRLWVRYPADLSADVQPAAGATSENRVSARVRDVSVGGAHLVVDQPFEPGQMLSLELPHAGGDRHVVLACVVRAVPEESGQWALGCVFSRELSDADLEGFGAKRVRPAPSDKRGWIRFPSDRTAKCQQIGDSEGRTFDAKIINLSASGVGLAVTHNVNSGALLSVDLLTNDGRVARTILACVVHVTTEPGGGWSLGCNFIRELSEDDLKAIV